MQPAAADRVCPPQRPAQQRLVEALTAPMDSSIGGYYRSRDNAIDAIVAYCSVAEGRAAHRAKISAKEHPDPNPHPPLLDDNCLGAAVLSVFVAQRRGRGGALYTLVLRFLLNQMTLDRKT